ncbi:MAG: DUF2089 domain-containing protein [Bacilli bacterium]
MEAIGKCPVCSSRLKATKLKCDNCGIEISGDFEMSKFTYLEKNELKFIELFLVNQGNIKLMEKELGISYPTVKKYLEQILEKLGLSAKENNKRREILEKLARGEISADEAEPFL